MSALPLELLICYTVVVSLSIILKIVKNSDKFKELHCKIKSLKKNVEESIKTNSINDLNSIIHEFDLVHQAICQQEILFELPE